MIEWHCGAPSSMGMCDFESAHKIHTCRFQVAPRWIPDWDQPRLLANAVKLRRDWEAGHPAYRRWRRFMDRLGS